MIMFLSEFGDNFILSQLTRLKFSFKRDPKFMLFLKSNIKRGNFIGILSFIFLLLFKKGMSL